MRSTRDVYIGDFNDLQVPGWINHGSVAHLAAPVADHSEQRLVCVFRLSRGVTIYLVRVWAILAMISALTLGYEHNMVGVGGGGLRSPRNYCTWSCSCALA